MESNKVYDVTSGDYSDYHIAAVFSTREKAEEYVDTHGSDYRIEEYPVDDEQVEKNESIWLVSVNWITGNADSANPQNFSNYYTDKVDTVRYDKSYGSGYFEFCSDVRFYGEGEEGSPRAVYAGESPARREVSFPDAGVCCRKDI